MLQASLIRFACATRCRRLYAHHAERFAMRRFCSTQQGFCRTRIGSNCSESVHQTTTRRLAIRAAMMGVAHPSDVCSELQKKKDGQTKTTGHTDIHTDKRTDCKQKETDRHTDKQADKQAAGGQAHTQTHRRRHINTRTRIDRLGRREDRLTDTQTKQTADKQGQQTDRQPDNSARQRNATAIQMDTKNGKNTKLQQTH